VLPGCAGVLSIGIGGGGDVVGALAVAELARSLGRPAVVGGLTWERSPIDPLPGPRRLDELVGAESLNACVAWCDADTTGPQGVPFCESHVAAALGERTLLVDPHYGPRRVGAALAHAARATGCDAVALVDVGGDVLAHGDEAGLASPLADAVLLAGSPAIATDGVAVVAAVFGAGCDAELTVPEVLERLAEVARAGGWLGTWSPPPAAVDRLAAVADRVPTEASAAAVRCLRGEHGETAIRAGRRTVPLTPFGGLVLLLDPSAAIDTASRLAASVLDAPDLRTANAILHRSGVRTELDLEEGRRP
jgi:hypothetical protein